MSENLLELKHITKEFFGTKALDDVNLTVREGEIHAICGENGAGKSTLMNVLSGVYPYGDYSGEIIYKGKECHFKDIKDSEREGIVIIHQELALSPYLSIAENIFMGNELLKRKGIIDWDKTKLDAREMLRRVGLPNEDVEQPVNSLGVGKQQLVEIAKAVAKKVDLLILDEPTASLNDNDSQTLLDIMLSLKKAGVTCILISHKLNEVNYVADRITIIRDGKSIETLDKEDITENRIIKGMVGRELNNRYPARVPHIGEPVLEVKDWTVYHPEYSDRQVIKGVDFHLNRGEVLGFAGLMGAGRTELAMSIFGHSYGLKPSGTVLKDGKEINVSDVRKTLDQGIVYVSEDRKGNGLVLMNDIKWNMPLSSLWKKRFSNHGVLNLNEETSAAQEYKEMLNIRSNGVTQTVGALSGGNQQKVVIAKAMLTDADILILDEPTRGIDVGAKYEIYTVINDLVAQGKSVIMISSEMPELLGMCDRIYVLNEGEIVGELDNDGLTQEDIMQVIMTHAGRSKNNEQ